MRRPTALLLLAAFLAASLSLAACGKKGKPEDVEGGNYPTVYPTAPRKTPSASP